MLKYVKVVKTKLFFVIPKIVCKLQQIKTYEKGFNCACSRYNLDGCFDNNTHLGYCSLYNQVLVNNMTKLHHQHT